jgi:DNA-binding CsgD family transcriptional regulator
MDQRQDNMRRDTIWEPLARANAATGTDDHVDRLIDLIGADIAHDLVTVTRYSATKVPEFVKHRRFSDEMVRRYLESYYVFDPFYASWRRERRRGIVPLRTLADDEVGILLDDGADWCLGIFLDRTEKPFRDRDITLLNERLPVFAALHALDLRARGPDFVRTSAPPGPGASPRREPRIPDGLWPELSARERELVQLVLAGHPTATIAHKLGITVGTAKNHRRRIYDKLDITTERELFLQYFQNSIGAG